MPQSLQCQVCARNFRRGEHLRRHVRTHTKEKPYTCHCGRSFARRDLLTRHGRLAHGQTPVSSPAASASDHANSTIHSNSMLDSPLSIGAHMHDESTASYDFSSFNQQDGAECDETMQSISSFLHTVGLDFDFDFDMMPTQGDANQHHNTAPASHGPETTDNQLHPPRPSTTHTQDGQRVVESIPIPSGGDDDFEEFRPVSRPWKITEDERFQFIKSLEPYSHIIGQVRLPSRLTMARYIAGFVDGYSNHHPFIHPPTLRVTACPASPELILSLMAIGAKYHYETAQALRLYRASRAIVLDRLRSGQLFHSRLASIPSRPRAVQMDTMRAILCLGTFASWQLDPSPERSLEQESMEYQPLLARGMRESGMNEASTYTGDNWLEWARDEADRRTKYSAFCLLNLQALVFNVPAPFLASDIDLQMPCSSQAWLAPDPASWARSRAEEPPRVGFKSAYLALLQSPPAGKQHHGSALSAKNVPVTTALGVFVLIQALLQRIMLSWQLALPGVRPGPGDAEISVLTSSLGRWKDAWHISPESVLDLRNSKGSPSWTATSLLGLAHVRLHYDLGTEGRRVMSRDPATIAAAAYSAAFPGRGAHLVRALLHSAHALNLPVQLGLKYLSNCQAFFWSLQHCFCAFEHAVFLSKWLFGIADSLPRQPLDGESSSISPNISQRWTNEESELKGTERRILKWLCSIVTEAQHTNNEDENNEETVGFDLDPAIPDQQPQADLLRNVGISVVKVFAQMFEQCNSAWPIMTIIGESLAKYATLLETGLGHE